MNKQVARSLLSVRFGPDDLDKRPVLNLREFVQTLTAHGRESNDKFQSNALFIKCCELAGVSPTKRQASKFRNGKGEAYPMRLEAAQLIYREEK